MAYPSGVTQSFGALNYSGMLYNKGNNETPLSTAIGGRYRTTQSVEFVIGQEYDGGSDGEQPNISETASLTAPDPATVTRSQKTNVTQIFHETVAVSYAKMSNMKTLSGLNIAGQTENPPDEFDFQMAQTMAKIGRNIEYTFIQGKYAKAGSDSQANKTRGVSQAITSNTIAMGSKPMTFWDVVKMMEKIDKGNAPVEDLVVWCDSVNYLQLTTDAVTNGLTSIPEARDVNGIKLDKLITPYGDIYIRRGKFIPSGEAYLLNLNVMSRVDQPTPDKGNFFLEDLAKIGASDRKQIFGQVGLDHGPEWYHGKFTGIKTTWEAPEYSKKVFVVNGGAP